MKSVKHFVVAAAAVAAVGTVTAAQADGLDLNNLTMRVRAIYIDPANKSDPINVTLPGNVLLTVPSDQIDIEKKWAPDIDFEYAVNKNLGVELLLTVPQTHDVVAATTSVGNGVKLGTVQHLPPTLTAKYYFLTDSIRPYLGAGVNFTWFTKSRLAVPGVTLSTDSTSFGPALQGGVDISVNDNWSVSLDAKKVWISTDVNAGATKITTVDVNPWIFGIGVGYRFGGQH